MVGLDHMDPRGTASTEVDETPGEGSIKLSNVTAIFYWIKWTLKRDAKGLFVYHLRKKQLSVTYLSALDLTCNPSSQHMTQAISQY